MDRIELCVTQNQSEAVLSGLRGLAALFGLAYHMRQSYYDLAKVVKSCANHEIDQQRAREDQLKIAIGTELVKSVLSVNPGQFASAAVDFAVTAVGDLAEKSIEGTGADAVVDAYRDRSVGLRETFESNLNQLSKSLLDEWEYQAETDATELEVMQPMPSCTDVTSPDFSYDDFWTEEYSPVGPFAEKIGAEREQYAQENPEFVTEITHRLEGQSK